MHSPWLAYNELAWTEDWLASPSDYEKEARFYVSMIREASTFSVETLLHLGSGAGGMDHVFKRYFSVTGVDLSPGMLSRARATHPDVEYVEGDMRSVRLKRLFDAVAIPDSIDYMETLDDLNQAVATAVTHLKPGGVLLVVGKTAETFQENNFAYTGEKEGIHLTLLENNFIDPFRPKSYEATLVFLVRRRGELSVHVDRHALGLFSQSEWERVFRGHGLTLSQTTLDNIYDPYLLNHGSYPLQVFVAGKEV